MNLVNRWTIYIKYDENKLVHPNFDNTSLCRFKDLNVIYNVHVFVCTEFSEDYKESGYHVVVLYEPDGTKFANYMYH